MATIAACKIQPVKAQFTDKVESTHLALQLINDNLSTVAVFQWQLIDDKCSIYAHGNERIAGTDYSGWDGNNSFPFTFIGEKLGVTFI